MGDDVFVSGILEGGIDMSGLEGAREMVVTLSRSSLILTQGRPFTALSLITMLSALLLSVDPLDRVRKSFVRKVPIPNDTGTLLGLV